MSQDLTLLTAIDQARHSPSICLYRELGSLSQNQADQSAQDERKQQFHGRQSCMLLTKCSNPLEAECFGWFVI